MGLDIKGNDVTHVAREREDAALGGPGIAVAGTSAETSNTAAVTTQPIPATATARAADAAAAAPQGAKREVQSWIANFMDKDGSADESTSARSASAAQGSSAVGAAATEGAAAAQTAAAAAATVPGTADRRLPGFLDRSEERAEKEQLAVRACLLRCVGGLHRALRALHSCQCSLALLTQQRFAVLMGVCLELRMQPHSSRAARALACQRFAQRQEHRVTPRRRSRKQLRGMPGRCPPQRWRTRRAAAAATRGRPSSRGSSASGMPSCACLAWTTALRARQAPPDVLARHPADDGHGRRRCGFAPHHVSARWCYCAGAVGGFALFGATTGSPASPEFGTCCLFKHL